MAKKRRRNDAPWRRECEAKRGAFCRACGSSRHVECDHMWPRSHQGPSVVENGLFLCGAWGDCKAHERKTNHTMVIEFDWLDPDQVAWLEEVGWVWWDENGEPNGPGCRGFGPRPRSRANGQG